MSELAVQAGRLCCGQSGDLGRFGEPEEFASLALELCRNIYINAQAFRLDAGIRFAAK